MCALFLEKSLDNDHSADALSGTDAAAIEQILIDQILKNKISGMAEGKAKKLYLKLEEILSGEKAEKKLKTKTEALSNSEKVLYAKFLTIRNSCRSAAMIIATRNTTSLDNPYDIDRMIGQMKEKGVKGKELEKVLSTITQWKTGTPHPTQHLSEEGKQLFRDILEANNLPPEERFQAAQKAISGMLNADITRKERMTVREETDSDREQAKLHRKAQRKTFFALQAALDKHYGDKAPQLLSGKIKMTLPYHTWNGAGDADGKPNADKKALLEGMVGYTVDAIVEHLDDVEEAIKLDKSLQKKLGNTLESLKKAHQRLEKLEAKLRDSNDETSFEKLKKEFEGVYKNLSVDHAKKGDASVNSEQELYEKLTKNLAHVIKDANPKAKQVLEGSLFVMRQYKDTFTTAKIEKRAPGPVDVEIMNKLFSDTEFQEAFLKGWMKRSLANKSFNALDVDEQRKIMRHIASQAKGDNQSIIEHYQRIFPEGLDDKGFPNQLHERAERLKLQALVPNKFGMSIVAEASEMSAEYQFFLGEQVFGVKPMMHTMLNEDMKTLEESPDYLIDFAKNGGLTSVHEAVAHNPRLGNYLEKHGAMLPCSDSTKQLGPGAFFMQAQAINLMMKFAVENNKTICIKWGNGQTLTRGGGNAHVPGRLKAQAVQWHLNGRALDLKSPEDIKILANIMFSSNTEQGRAADFMSPNADRISINHLNMIGEMLGRTLELTGKSPKGEYIPQVAKFSKGARKIFSQIAKDTMMRGYENFRDAVYTSKNQKIENQRMSDEVAEKVSNMKVAADAGQAARPGSKAVEVKEGEEVKAVKTGKALYDLRAIGTTISISHMRTYHDGWFTLGEGLREVHKAYLGREIGDGDLKAFMDDPLWTSMIKNGLRTSSMSDMRSAFKKLDAGDWSHAKAMKIGKSVRIIPSEDPKKNPPVFTFDGEEDGVTPEQAYIAKLYYDQALFVAYTEILAEFKNNPDFVMPKTLDEVEQRAELHLSNTKGKIGRFEIGANTNNLFPFVDQNENGNRVETLPSQILADVAEDIHGEFSQEEKYAITAAQRSATVTKEMDLALDQDAYGSKPAIQNENANKKGKDYNPHLTPVR